MNMSNDRLEMNLMWIAMGAMLIHHIWMVLSHSSMHKRLNALEDELKNIKSNK